MKMLDQRFYNGQDPVKIARELIGCILVTCFDGAYCSGRIVETEAYAGVSDRASHAYGGRRTARTEIMYREGGTAYVYLCYGIHHLFNVVTNKKEIPHAVLIRALEPLEGLPHMLRRRVMDLPDYNLTRGPGNLAQAMGISVLHSGFTLTGKEIFIAKDGFRINHEQVEMSRRIGVDYAGKDAVLPYRFFLKNNPWVSKMPANKKNKRPDTDQAGDKNGKTG